MSALDRFRGEWRDGWFVVPYHVLFADIDAFGHVNNAVFFTYFEWGRTQLWFELTEWGGARDIGFIVARAECDFKKQLSMEPIEIWTRIGEMGTSSLEFLCEIRTKSRRRDGSLPCSSIGSARRRSRSGTICAPALPPSHPERSRLITFTTST
ncbi:MAG: acyl-CoA thioesterase [Acidobacteriota bacterium]|nr:acyl-CoA thioesterase [Acidobacteriota bacterium]